MRLLRSQNSILLAGLLLALSLAFVLLQVDQAQAARVGNKSLKGKYTLEAKPAGSTASPSLSGGWVEFDGAGNITDGGGWFAGDIGAGYTVYKVLGVVGTYRMRSNRTGTMNVTYTLKGVGPVPRSAHMAITVRKKLSGYDEALELFVFSDDANPDGSVDTLIFRKW